MSVDLISLNNDYFINTVNRISKVIIYKNTPVNYFPNIFNVLFTYLKDHKDHRTIENIRDAFDLATEELSLESFEDMNNKKIEREIKHLRVSAKHFIEENAQKIERTFYKTKAKSLLLRWIIAYDEAMNTFLLFLQKTKVRKYLIRRPGDFNFYLFRLVEGLFLVLYRIVEQIYMLANDIAVDEDKEKEYLVGDLVYYDNLQRSLLYEAFHGK